MHIKYYTESNSYISHSTFMHQEKNFTAFPYRLQSPFHSAPEHTVPHMSTKLIISSTYP
ncbi:hypothetical protein C0J52_24415 [Blattella germanica]|nr:hypothetical protein C0J52_24415 [Blattella germanica]